jgi:hypothetical protein
LRFLRVWAGFGALALLAASPAAAQNRPLGPAASPGASLAEGITVSGFATRDVPATKAATTVRISSSKPFTLAEIKPLLDAVAKADGSGAQAVLPPFLMMGGGPMRQFTATGTVDHPTVKMLAGAIPVISAAFASAPQFTLDNAMVRLSVENCAAYVDQVRSDAVRDARRRAEAIARDLGVRLGAVEAVAATDQMQDQGGACTRQYFFPGGYGPNEPASIDDYVSVPVSERVTIRFAIVGSPQTHRSP